MCSGSLTVGEDPYELARVQQIAVSSARTELDRLLENHVVSGPTYSQLRQEIERELKTAEQRVADLYGEDTTHTSSEVQTARMKLVAAKKSAIEDAVHDGLISQQSANKMIEAADQELDTLTDRDQVSADPP